MNYIATGKLYNGQPTTIWIRDVANLKEAFQKAIEREQALLPEIEPKENYSSSSDRHWHEKEMIARRLENEKRIKEIVELKIWHLG